jgi:ATP-dependent Lon protease
MPLPSEEECNQFVEFALEGRRRVKEQINKTKRDDEYWNILKSSYRF